MIKKAIVYLILEIPVQKRGLGELADQLKANGEKLHGKMQQLPDKDFNRALLRHIIGIERWGQNRLRVGLGEPLVNDEYDNYRPNKETPWEKLHTEFCTTRQTTVALAHDLEEVKADLKRSIPHNAFGELTLRGWLRYLNLHANLEFKKAK